MTVKVLDSGPIRHAEIERYHDPDIETALAQDGIDPRNATDRLIEVTLDGLEDARWFPDPTRGGAG